MKTSAERYNEKEIRASEFGTFMGFILGILFIFLLSGCTSLVYECKKNLTFCEKCLADGSCDGCAEIAKEAEKEKSVLTCRPVKEPNEKNN